MNELLEYAAFLTGYEESEILYMFNAWRKYKKTSNKPIIINDVNGDLEMDISPALQKLINCDQ